LPSVNRLYEDLNGKGLTVLLVNFRESADAVKRAVQERGYTAPVLIDENGDLTGRVYGVFGPPTIYFVDRGGRLVGRASGPLEWETPAARRFVEELLAMPAPR
jgi:hypothetical protein